MLILYIVFIVHGLFWLNPIPQSISSWSLFEMPAIFLISGYSYYLSENSKKVRLGDRITIKQYSLVLVSRLTRILIPYFLYVAACIVFIIILLPPGREANYELTALIFTWVNPVRYGRGFSTEKLNGHLWFIPVFLIVTALMPIATKFKPFKNPNILTLVFGFAIFEYLFSITHFPADKIIKEAVFYLLFSLLGYYLAQPGDYFRRSSYPTVAIVSLALLGLIATVNYDIGILNMQTNKFPPNHLFFLFSCLWISFFLYILFKVPLVAEKFMELGDTFWLRPFISSGYSIYLWQGLGYTVAIQAGKTLNIPIIVVWIIAILLSIGLGIIASPAERIRLRL